MGLLVGTVPTTLLQVETIADWAKNHIAQPFKFAGILLSIFSPLSNPLYLGLMYLSLFVGTFCIVLLNLSFAKKLTHRARPVLLTIFDHIWIFTLKMYSSMGYIKYQKLNFKIFQAAFLAQKFKFFIDLLHCTVYYEVSERRVAWGIPGGR